MSFKDNIPDPKKMIKDKGNELKEKAIDKLKNKLGLTDDEVSKEKTKGSSTAIPEADFILLQEATLANLLKERDSLAIKTIEKVMRHSGYGMHSASLYTIINGLNITAGKPQIPHNTDHQGYTFFTRPQCNLSYDNVITHRRMSAYADQRPDNAANAIRCMLHPLGFLQPIEAKRKVNYGIGLNKSTDLSDIRSSIVDDDNCFIPLLSNCLINFSGLPDLSPDTYTSKEGISKEQVSWYDDRPYQRNVFDASSSFTNTDGNILTHLFHCWIEYGTRVAEGTMVPFPINVATNRVDYQTKIYRILMDRTKRYVQGIAATIAYPTAYPIGRNYDFNSDQRLSLDSKEINVPWRCIGVEYDDPILIKEFNQLVRRFNPRMLADAKFAPKGKGVPAHRVNMPIPDPKKMVEITEAEKLLFNYKAYPFIALSNELLWYTPIETYNNLKKL